MPASNVTLPRELAESLLVLMTRTVTDGAESVPPGQWLVFANALDRALHPKTHAGAAMRGLTADESRTLRAAVAEAAASGVCEGCRATTDGVRRASPFLCPSCYDEFVADLAQLDDRPEHPGTRCNDACGHCGACA